MLVLSFFFVAIKLNCHLQNRENSLASLFNGFSPISAGMMSFQFQFQLNAVTCAKLMSLNSNAWILPENWFEKKEEKCCVWSFHIENVSPSNTSHERLCPVCVCDVRCVTQSQSLNNFGSGVDCMSRKMIHTHKYLCRTTHISCSNQRMRINST